MHLVYFFYIFQSAGILTTTLAAGYDIKYLIWVGVTLNAFASLINIYEKTNNSINDRLLDNINEIRNGTYIDQTNFVDPTDDYTNIISPSIQNPKSPVISPNTELKTLKPNLSLEP
jgi:hypothetical protein